MKKNNKISFTSTLKDKNNNLLAKGITIVNISEQSLIFKSDFVPLYSIGTTLLVYRLFENKEVHCFKGNVFISDKKFLKLILLEDRLLPGSEMCYSSNVNFSATLKYSPKKQGVTSIFQYYKRNKNLKEIPINIIKMDSSRITFTSNNLLTNESKKNFMKTNISSYWDISNGDNLTISLSNPLPRLNLYVEVTQCLYLGECPSYQCQIITLSNNDLDILTKFLWEYNIINNQLF